MRTHVLVIVFLSAAVCPSAKAADFCSDLERAVSAAKQQSFKNWIGKRDPDLDSWESKVTLSLPKYTGPVECSIEEDDVRREQRTVHCLAINLRSASCALTKEDVADRFQEVEQCLRSRFPAVSIRRNQVKGTRTQIFDSIRATNLGTTSDGFRINFATTLAESKRVTCPLWSWEVGLE